MGFKTSYKLGEYKGDLELTAERYNAWPKGLVSCGPSIAQSLIMMTEQVRESARFKAEKIEPPKNTLDKIGFYLGYLAAPHRPFPNICTSEGPINPFTGRKLFQRD